MRKSKYNNRVIAAVVVLAACLAGPAGSALAGVTWTQEAKLVAGDGEAGDQFGGSISINGSTAIVGAMYDAHAGPVVNAGSAYIFDAASGWTPQVQRLIASDAGANRHFGRSVGLSGQTAIVGTHNYTKAYVFDKGVSDWTETKLLTGSDTVAGDLFGDKVAISGSTAVVGAPRDDDGAGSAYIFGRNHDGDDNWGQVAKLVASDPGANDYFGSYVAIDGDTTIIASYNDASGAGSAYIFQYDYLGTGAWDQVAKLVASDATTSDYFGNSAAISGDTVIVGAYGNDDDGNMSGSAYIFGRDEGGDDSWGQVAKLLAGDGAAGDLFGLSVAIDGDTTFIGARDDDDNSLEASGSVYVFDKTGLGWTQVDKLHASDPGTGDKFGIAVALSGNFGLIGAYKDDAEAGSAYVFVPEPSTASLLGVGALALLLLAFRARRRRRV